MKKTTKPRGRPFKKGEVANPKGRKPIYEDFRARGVWLLEKYTLGEMLDLLTAAKDKKHAKHAEARKVPMRDMILMTSLYSGITNEGKIPAALMLDRILGKVSDHIVVDQSVEISHDVTKEAEDEAERDMQRLADRMKTPAPKVH